MGSHSIIPPSSAAIWGSPNGCTGWVLMAQMYPEDEPTQESLEGEASHEVGAMLINNAKSPTAPHTMATALNGVLIDDEMREAAEVYADDVIAIMRKFANFAPNVEQHIKCPTIHDLSEGTPDCWLYDQKTGHLYIWDYKYGYGIIEVFENWQLINYVAGIITQLELTGIQTQHVHVHLRVVQPRAFHRDGMIREWVVPASDLRGYFNVLETNAALALSSDAITRSGSHCKHCTARHACPSALQAGIQLYEVAGQPLPVELPHDALGVQLAIVNRAIKQLEFVQSGLQAQVTSMIKAGGNVPGWNVENATGRKKWNVPVAEVIALGVQYKKDLSKPTVITPTQAKKLGITEDIIDAYSVVPNTGLKLVPDNENKVKRIFKP